MDPVLCFYHAHSGVCNAVMALLIFGGMARIAFWRNESGMQVGGPLALGLGLLLTGAILLWARENSRTLAELGPWALLVLLEAIVLMVFNARRKSKEE